MAWVLRPLDLILAACFGSNGRGGLDARAAALTTERGGARPRSRRSSPIRRSGGRFEPGMGRGACPRYAQSTGVQIGMLRGWERGSHRQGRLGGGGISAGERVRAARVAYGLNRLTQKRGEVGMWLTGARIERGVMQVAPAARSIRGSRRRLREGLLQWSSGVWIPRIDSGWCCGSVQRVREVRGSPGMSNWPEIGVYRGWGARRDSSDAVQELERGRLRKSPRADAKRLRRSAGPGVPWRGRSAAEQGAAEQSGGAERRGVAARVGGGASAWDGKLGVRGRFKGERPEISGSGSGRKAAVVSAGDLGRSVGRALKEEGGPELFAGCPPGSLFLTR